jgi:hypothetical protein
VEEPYEYKFDVGGRGYLVEFELRGNGPLGEKTHITANIYETKAETKGPLLHRCYVFNKGYTNEQAARYALMMWLEVLGRHVRDVAYLVTTSLNEE